MKKIILVVLGLILSSSPILNALENNSKVLINESYSSEVISNAVLSNQNEIHEFNSTNELISTKVYISNILIKKVFYYPYTTIENRANQIQYQFFFREDMTIAHMDIHEKGSNRLLSRNFYYPGTLLDGQQGKYLQYEFFFKKDMTIAHMNIHEKGSNRLLSRNFYYPGTLLDGQQGKYLQYEFFFRENMTISGMNHHESGTQRLFATNLYYDGTYLDGQQGKYLQYEFFFKPDRTLSSMDHYERGTSRKLLTVFYYSNAYLFEGQGDREQHVFYYNPDMTLYSSFHYQDYTHKLQYENYYKPGTYLGDNHGNKIYKSINHLNPSVRPSNAKLGGHEWLGGHGVHVLYNQCVELAARLYREKGWGTIFANGGNVLYGNGAKYIPEGSQGPNGGKLNFYTHYYRPVPGDLIIDTDAAYGHVAVVDYVVGDTVYIVEQNGHTADGRYFYTYRNGRLYRGNGGTASRGVIHSPANPNR